MATIVGSTNNSNWGYHLDVYEIYTSVETNESVVRVDSWVVRTGATGSSGVPIHGDYNSSSYIETARDTSESQVQNFSARVDAEGLTQNSRVYVTTKDFTIRHEADGSKTIRVTSELFASGFTPSYCVADGYVTLSTIPRATVAPSITGYIKSTYTLNISPASNSFTHSLYFWLNNVQKWVQANGELGDTEYIFSTRNPIITFPKECYNEFDGFEGVGTFKLKTYNGSQLIGENQQNFKVQCNPALCTPSITSATVVDVYDKTIALSEDENDIIKFASHALVTPVIQISDVDDTRATIRTKSIDGTIFTTDTVTVVSPSSNSFQIALTNTRGHSSNNLVQSTGELINYVPLTFNLVNIARTEPTSSDVRVEYNGNYFNGSFSENNTNELHLTWEAREKNSETLFASGTLTPTINSEENTFSGNEILVGAFDYTKQYDFIFYWEDAIIEGETNTSISRGLPVYWWTDDSFHIIGDLYVTGEINPSV